MPRLVCATCERDSFFHRSRSFRFMARHLAALVARVNPGDFERAGAGVVCELCRLEYVEHPTAPEGSPLTILCDGRRVKL